MWDKVELRIPLHPIYVPTQRLTDNGLSGIVVPDAYDAPLTAQRIYRVDGVVKAEGISSPWESIASSFSDVAFKFFHAGNGFYEWPHVIVKASPAKILQGHNVYGSEDLRPGVEEILFLLSQQYPFLWSHLHLEETEIRWLDATYSGIFESDFFIRRFLDFVATQADRKHSVDNRYNGTLYISRGSDSVSLKLYIKALEMLEDIKKAKLRRRFDRVAILQQQLDFALNRLRFEASIRHKKMVSLGIPTKLRDFYKFSRWFESVHSESVCKYLWKVAFDHLLSGLEGHTMRRVDDDAIRLKIFSKLTKVSDSGKVCRRLANAVWKTYQSICTHGYNSLSREGNQTFFRNVNHLVDCGLSRAFLKSLHPNRPRENVFPLINIVNIDFANQRPVDWVEPVPRSLQIVKAA